MLSPAVMPAARIALGVGAALVALAFHELGHLVAGLLVGFNFSLFAIGPVLVERLPSGGLRVGWNRTPAFIGGVAATYPTRAGGLRPRFAIVVVAGPVFSLVLAVAAAAVLPSMPHSAHVLRLTLGWLRLLSGLVFLGTALPVRNGAFVTDGLRFLRIVRRGPRGERELALITLTCSQLDGTRPRDWDRRLIANGLAVRDGSMFECQMHLYAYLQAVDSGDLPQAGSAIARAVALAAAVPAPLKADCLLEAAWFASVHRGQAATARAFLDRVPARAHGVLESDRLRARGAVALGDGDVASARLLLADALACCPAWASGPRAWIGQLLASVPAEE